MILGAMACNVLFAKYASPITDSLNITEWSSTTRACLPESDGNRESQFAIKMKLIARYEIATETGHRTLTFYDASDFLLLQFVTLNQSYLPIVMRNR
jgi:hypothetical protein